MIIVNKEELLNKFKYIENDKKLLELISKEGNLLFLDNLYEGKRYYIFDLDKDTYKIYGYVSDYYKKEYFFEDMKDILLNNVIDKDICITVSAILDSHIIYVCHTFDNNEKEIEEYDEEMQANEKYKEKLDELDNKFKELKFSLKTSKIDKEIEEYEEYVDETDKGISSDDVGKKVIYKELRTYILAK